MLTRSLNLNELPQEGTWFVRWIDGFVRRAKSTSNPEIEIAFEQIPDDRWEGLTFAEVVAENEPPPGSEIRPRLAQIGRFHAGVITGLPIGAVIQNGAHVGELEAPIMPFTVRLPDDLFAASSHADSFGLVLASTTVKKLLGNGSAVSLVPAEIYRTFLVPQLVTPVRIADGLLVLPSSVVIRAFISPVSAVIRDLMRRPPTSAAASTEPKPESLLHAVLGPGTGVMDTGRWRVALDPKISARHAPLLANLHEAFDAYGHLAAWRVNEGVTHSPRRLAGPVPFTGCSLQMGVRVYEIAPGHLLALDVASAQWPYANTPEIDVVRWVPEGDTSDQVLHRPGGRAGLAADRPPDIRREDAHDAADVVVVRTKGPVWEALPKQQESRQTFRHEADRWVGVTSASPTTVATVGGSGPYGDAHAAVLEQQPGEPSKIERVARFEEILALFDQLRVSNPDENRGTIAS